MAIETLSEALAVTAAAHEAIRASLNDDASRPRK
jgi:hypothetical protein